MATIQPNTFVPTSISGCTLWLDGADSSKMTFSGNIVISIIEKSNNIVYTPSASTLTTTTINNVQSLNFPGTTYLTGTLNNQTTGYAFMLVRTTSSGNAGYYPFFNWHPNSDVSNFYQAFGYSGSATSVGPYISNVGVQPTQTTVSVGNTYLFSFSWNGTATTVGVNGALVPTSGTQSSNLSAANIVNTLYICRDTGSTTTINIGEMIMYNTSNLTNAQRQQVEGYLAWKWGIQSSLPSTHPFRYLPPTSTGVALTLYAPLSLPSQSMSPSSSAFFFFRPTTITGCVLWLDANDPNGTGIQPANNATVSTWTDKSGIANNATGGSAQFQVNRQNSLPGVYFGGATSFGLSKPGAIPGGTTTSATFFAVFAGSGNDVGILAQTGAAGVACDKTGRLYYINTNSGNMYSTLYCGAAQVSTSYTLNTPFLLSDIYVNTGSGSYNHFAWSSGTSIGSAGVTGVNTGNTTVRIGDSLTGGIFTGYMYELIMFAAALTDAQRQQVEGYLAWKWGLNGQLPASHPFKTTLPGLPIAIPGTRLMQQASFRPSQISGLQLWLDGQDPNGNGTVPANGVSISTWTDKSGAGNSATSGTAVTYNTTGISNYPVMSFTGAPSYFSSTDLYSNRSFSVYIVCRRQAANSSSQSLIGGTTLAANQNMIILFTSATNLRFAFFGNDLDATIPAYTGNTATEPAFIFAFTYTPGSRNISVNGTVSASDANTTNLTASLGERIGAWTSTPASYAYTGFIGEILVYNGVPTTAQRQSVEGYLAWKWNLVSNLPANHPYKKFPPSP